MSGGDFSSPPFPGNHEVSNVSTMAVVNLTYILVSLPYRLLEIMI